LALTAKLVASVHDVGHQATILSRTRAACQIECGQGTPAGNRQPGQLELMMIAAEVNSRALSQSGDSSGL
jgi:hypothetical protein